MSNVITVKINVSKINKERLFKGKNGTYLDLVLIPSKPSNFGDQRDENTHMVCQSVTKAERDAGIKGEILGNAVEKVGDRDRRPPAAKPQPDPEAPEADSIPFDP